MAMVETEVLGLDEVMEKLGRVASPATLTRGMRKAVNLVQAHVATYPPASRKPMVWASERQRRYVMAMIRRGRIQVPYRRTGTLGRRWTTEVVTEGADVVGKVGNNTVYGPYVMGREQQAAYHSGTWPIAVEVAAVQRPAIVQCFMDAATDALSGR